MNKFRFSLWVWRDPVSVMNRRLETVVPIEVEAKNRSEANKYASAYARLMYPQRYYEISRPLKDIQINRDALVDAILAAPVNLGEIETDNSDEDYPDDYDDGCYDEEDS